MYFDIYAMEIFICI